ncbi:MAG: ATP phosphoribosyltransferase [Anaerolineales bacterium]
MPSDSVRLALPSKGQLGESTLMFFRSCGLTINKTNPRQYTATIPAMPEIEVLFQRSADISRTVSQGDVDLGITGFDTLEEHALEDDAHTRVLHDALGYGGCSLVIAVPDSWNVQTTQDLSAFAAQQGGLRVATSFPNLTTKFLTDHQVAPIKVVLASGALEAMPTIGSADFISDITATGTTLRDNHLHVLQDGKILYSEACLVANPTTLRQKPAVQRVARRLLERFEAFLAAEARYLVFANIRGESPEAVAERLFTQTELGGLNGPTIAPVYSRQSSPAGHWYSVSIVVDGRNLYGAIHQLRAIDGSGVVVTPITYIFDEYPARCRALDEFIQSNSEEQS